MAAIFTLRKGSTNASPSLTEAELYLHLGSGSIQFGSGSTKYNLLPLDAPVKGDVILTGNITASNAYFSGDVAISGNLFLGNNTSDNISALGVFTSDLKPGTSNTYNIGSTTAVWANVYANNISASSFTGSFSGSIGGIDFNQFSSSVDSRLDQLETDSGSQNTRITSLESKATTLQTYTASINTRIDQLATDTGSQNTRITNLETKATTLQTYTASVDNRLSSLETDTGSQNTRITTLETKATTLQTYTASVDSKFNTIQSLTASLNLQTASFNTWTGSVYNNFSESVDSRLDNVESYTSSLKNAISASGQDLIVYGNLTVQGTQTTLNTSEVTIEDKTLTLASGSTNGADADKAGLYIAGADVSMSWNNSNQRVELNKDFAVIGSISASSFIGLNGVSLSNYSTSVDSRLVSIQTNLLATSASVNGHIVDINSKTGSYATTGSNTFNGTQRIVGNTSITGGLDIYSASWAEIRLRNGDIGIDYHIQNTAGGNFSIHNKDLNASTFRIDSGSTLNEAHVHIFADLYVTTGSVYAQKLVSAATASFGKIYAIGPAGEISGSISGIGNVSQYSQSVDSRLDSLELSTSSLYQYTSSNDTTNTNQNNRLSILEESTASLNTFSASINGHVSDINTYTASINVHVSDINAWTGSQKQKDTTLESVTASLNLQTASFNIWTGSIFQPFSTSVDTRLDSLEYTVTILSPGGLEASLLSINSATQSLQWFSQSIHLYTASLNDTIARLKESTASINLTTASINGHISDINVWSGSAKTSITNLETKATTLETYTASVNGHIADINAYTSSNNTTNTNQNNRLSRLEESTASLNSYTASLKTAIALNGTNVTINGDLSVLGTTTQINSTQVNIGENILELNFGGSATTAGIYTRDVTGGSTTSGSLLWNATDDIWIAGKKGSEAKVLTDGMGVISGSGQLGSYETTGRGIISSSAQIDTLFNLDGIVSSSAQITPLLPNGVVSGSSQVSYLGLTNIPAGIISSSAQIDTLFNIDGLVSGSSQIDATLTTNWTTGVKTQLDNNTVVSGSSQVSYLGLSNIPSGIISSSAQIDSIFNIDGLVSGSSQINFTGLSGISANIISASSDTAQVDMIITGGSISANLKGGVVSGSGQIDVSSTTGDITLGTRTSGNYVATITGTANQITVAGSGVETAAITLSTPQDIATTSNVQFGSIGVGTTASGVSGEIRATGDIVAFYSSDERLKENIQPIQNALSKVESISGNTYDWKEGFETIHSHTGNDLGVIAQEVQSVLPEVVTERESGYLAVDYVKLVPVLIEAIKELSARVKELENK